MRRVFLLLVLSLALAFVGCAQDEQKEAPASSESPAASKTELEHNVATAEQSAGQSAINAVGKARKEPIVIGVLSDLSGPTSSVGVSYAAGIMDCIAWLNAQGGVEGHPLEALQVDYAYDVQQALGAYADFKKQGIVALQAWGTGDTEALVEAVANDQIPTLSASYSARLTDPGTAPYNFFSAADYSTQIRAALNYLKESWSKERPPRVAFIYPDHLYGLAPIPAAKKYAHELGFEVVGEENVGLNATDATTQLLRLQKAEPDFIWVGGTTPSTAVIMKDAEKLRMDVTFFVNIWGADENIFKPAGDAAEGHISLQTAAVYNDDTEGCRIIRELSGGQYQMTHYVRGFASMLVLAEAMKRAALKGTVSGPAIKNALESMRDYDPLGLTPPISFYPDDHRPFMAVKLYRLRNGGLELVSTKTLDRTKQWLGK